MTETLAGDSARDKSHPPPARCGAACANGHGMKFLIFVGINLGGCVGWELGGRFGTRTAFVVSGIGSRSGGAIGRRTG